MKINYNRDMVRNRFNQLLEEKRKREKRHIPLLEVSQQTGLPYKTIWSWAHDDLTYFKADTIETLCRYFAVPLGSLLELAE
jgi:hypothetical protein